MHLICTNMSSFNVDIFDIAELINFSHGGMLVCTKVQYETLLK